MKLMLVFCLSLLSFFPQRSIQTRRDVLLVYGESLPMAFLLEIKEERHIALYSIPMSLYLSDPCVLHYPTAIANVSDRTCMIDALEAAFPFQISDTIYLHTKAIESAFETVPHAEDISEFSDIQRYFDTLAQHVDLSALWHIGDYIDCDLSLSQLWRAYRIFTADDITIDYYFLHLFVIDAAHTVALDATFYQK